MPTISVIIPVYNAEKYLQKCMNSLMKQTFTNFGAIYINLDSKMVSHWWENIFSIKKSEYRKTIRICGLKFTKNKRNVI